MHSSQNVDKPGSSPASYQLHNLILEYLSHHCYSETANAFARDTAIKHIDADGDEIMSPSSSSQKTEVSQSGAPTQALKSMHMRQGRVDEAITMISENFPSVLDTTNSSDPTLYQAKTASGQVEYVSTSSVNPAHISLNLRILAFTEACRTIPLHYEAPSLDANLPPPIPPFID
ncbi:hypothetical protein ONZ45_g13076 [Pleurotus djamor]|nr:hypothetical protein ONZ45_g13076 [Pleurotus djamor]